MGRRVKNLSILTVIAACFAWPSLLLADTPPRDKVVASHYPPLMIEGNLDRPGYAVEVLQEAARRSGRAVDLQFLPFERAIHAILTEQGTLMPALFKGKERDKDILWMAEIQRTGLKFSSLAGPVDSLDEARALPLIVVERGTTPEFFLSQLGFANIQKTRSPEASANMLASGRAQAWLLSEPLMRRVWQRLDMDGTLVVGEMIHEVPVFLVANLALPDDIRRAYVNAVTDMRADGTLARIAQTYESAAD